MATSEEYVVISSQWDEPLNQETVDKNEIASYILNGSPRITLAKPKGTAECLKGYDRVYLDGRITVWLKCKSCSGLLVYNTRTGTGAIKRHKCLKSATGSNGKQSKISMFTHPRATDDDSKQLKEFEALCDATDLCSFSFVEGAGFQLKNSTEDKFNSSYLTTAKYLFNKDLSDVTFVALNEETGEKETIFGHKLILADNCLYFKNLFYGESNGETSILNNKSIKIMKPLLEYVYTKKIAEEIGFETALSLCELAIDMNYDALITSIFDKYLSERIIDIEITIENIPVIYFMSKKFSLASVVQRCNCFIEKHAEEIVSNKFFAKLDIFDAVKVVREAVKVMDNIEVFKAIVNRVESVSSDNSVILLRLLNLRTIDQENFAKFIRPTKLIDDDEYFAAFWKK
ncbi:BTB/POZ domain-containing protein 9-like protein [Leptotrombidium deliense]|uniref:BTB/POZ domain-containing protein 9-like protein n=1 Tax=Leptotrombidium deliense TaxID=299467 RepID=A0A443S1T9_9ACAR|nr:BTB/POZ domain-containing protein 9-like protein [Leptotrombidium deliense]